MDVQAFDPTGHAAGADLRSQWFHCVALAQVGLVCGPVSGGELRVGGEAVGHLTHRAAGLNPPHQAGQPFTG